MKNTAVPNQVIVPKDVAPPFSRYAHAIATDSGCRWLHVSGQLGVMSDGTLAAGTEAQIEQAFANIFAILAEAGMDKNHLVKLTVFLTRAEDVPIYRQARDRMLEGRLVAVTMVIVAGLAGPDFLVEIEAVAAAPAG